MSPFLEVDGAVGWTVRFGTVLGLVNGRIRCCCALAQVGSRPGLDAVLYYSRHADNDVFHWHCGVYYQSICALVVHSRND